jgi:hypothetical protein
MAGDWTPNNSKKRAVKDPAAAPPARHGFGPDRSGTARFASDRPGQGTTPGGGAASRAGGAFCCYQNRLGGASPRHATAAARHGMGRP